MAQCKSKHCKAELVVGWQFCAYCGTDNRPPQFRPPILACPHLFFESEGFCVRCGDCRDGRPNASQREVQANIGKTFLKLGVFVTIIAIAVEQIHHNQVFGNQWIQSWYDDSYMSEGKRVLRGEDYVAWAETGGVVLFGLGLMAVTIARMNAGKRRRRAKSAPGSGSKQIVP